MSSLAVLYDIHGNLPALEAALADARRAGAERFLLGGDYALFGPWPGETVDVLQALPTASWVRGNGERWTNEPSKAPQDAVVQGAIAACRAALGNQLVGEFATLPSDVELDGTLYCHASPLSDIRSFMPQPAGDDEELLAGVRQRRVIFGHTHVAFRRAGPDGVELVNPGSVGMPFDRDPRAAYALVLEDGHIEHRRVPYDHMAAAEAVRWFGEGASWAETIARRIADARP